MDSFVKHALRSAAIGACERFVQEVFGYFLIETADAGGDELY